MEEKLDRLTKHLNILIDDVRGLEETIKEQREVLEAIYKYNLERKNHEK